MTRDMAKGARFSFYGMLFLMGSVFWIATKAGRFRMSPDVYGAAVEFPASIWAGAMFIPAAVYLGALFVNGNHWLTPYVRLACGAWLMTYFCAFVIFAYPASGGDLMVVASSVLAAKAFVMSYFDACDLQRSRHAPGN